LVRALSLSPSREGAQVSSRPRERERERERERAIAKIAKFARFRGGKVPVRELTEREREFREREREREFRRELS